MISIIVLSSDGYSDCWNPFFTLIKKNFPDINNHELILSSNELTYSHEGLNIVSLTNGLNASWSKRLELSLNKAKNDVVLVVIEDFFLRQKVDINLFNQLVHLIESKKEIDHIRLRYKLNKYKVKKSRFELLEEIEAYTKHRFLYLPGLWKKHVLKSYLKDFESPYMAEKMANYRSYIRQDGFYSISNEVVQKYGQIYDCYGSGAIYKGKWNKWVQPYLEKNNIDINYSIRGVVTKEYEKNSRKSTKVNLMKEPLMMSRSFISLISLLIKEKLPFKINN